MEDDLEEILQDLKQEANMIDTYKQKFKKISFIGNKAYFQSIADKNKMKMLFSKFKIIILNSKWKSEGQHKNFIHHFK